MCPACNLGLCGKLSYYLAQVPGLPVPLSSWQHFHLQVILMGQDLAKDVSISKLAEKTDGFSGSDLRQLCTTAAMHTIRDLLAATGKSATAAPTKTAAGRKRQRLEEEINVAGHREGAGETSDGLHSH